MNQQFLKDLYKDDKQVALMSADKLFKYIKKNKPEKKLHYKRLKIF